VKTRAFCPACGSPVYMTFAAMPDLFTVHAASLDHPSRYAPQVVTYGVATTPGTVSIPPCRNSKRCRRRDRAWPAFALRGSRAGLPFGGRNGRAVRAHQGRPPTSWNITTACPE
jgi:hypothetical protein